MKALIQVQVFKEKAELRNSDHFLRDYFPSDDRLHGQFGIAIVLAQVFSRPSRL